MGGDTYTGRNVGAMGPHVTANNTTFIDYGSMASGLDLAVLADELCRLKDDMKKVANDTKELEAVVAISAAEDAARKGDGSTAMAKLKAAGGWAWDTATKIGVPVAAEAIKKAIALG